MWFDDFWHAEEPPAPEHAAAWRASLEGFRDGFTAAEMAVLTEFHRFFARRAEGLPEDDLEELLSAAAWQEIMTKARVALATFEGSE